LIPSLDVAKIARPEGEWLVLELQPGSAKHRKLDRYRTPLESLGVAVMQLLSPVGLASTSHEWGGPVR
jgi:hypothetical protein